VIIHLGDVAGTSRTFVDLARNEGLDWVLREVPPGRGRPAARVIADRATDLAGFLRSRRDIELLHVNYGVSGYYGWGSKIPWVLHLHGTDIRQDLGSRWLGPVVRHSIQTADRVLVATRDLLPAVMPLRPDAEWFPSPLPIGAFGRLDDAPERDPSAPVRVFYCSRWDESKGADELLRSAAELVTSHPDWDVVGLDWGRHAAQAGRIGVRLLPYLTTSELRAQLDLADVVVGQTRLGELGLTDLEAMLRRRPLVARYTAGDFEGEALPLWNTTEAPIVDHVEAIVAAGPADELVRTRTWAAREWVRHHHHPLALFARLKRTYAALGVRIRF
jgi:glycosyltransferase involved in cell wall biosynthesis